MLMLLLLDSRMMLMLRLLDSTWSCCWPARIYHRHGWMRFLGEHAAAWNDVDAKRAGTA